MQNKPNFRKSQMNVNLYNTTDYKNICNWTLGENKPNSNPIKPNLLKDKTNATLFATKDYRKKDDFTIRINKPNSRKTQNERKRFLQKDYENETAFRPKKTNPIQNQFQTGHQPPHTSYLPPIFFKKYPKKCSKFLRNF